MMPQRKHFTVRKRVADDLVGALPAVEPMPATIDLPDILIIAAGFEERILHAPRRLAPCADGAGCQVLLGRYKTNEADNASRCAQLLPLLEPVCRQPPVDFDADSPESVRMTVFRALSLFPIDAVPNILFDISGASAQLIFSVFGALRITERRVRLRVAYTTAQSYGHPPAAASEVAERRETGVSDVVRNEMYAGFHHDGLRSFAIAFPSIVSTRLQRCLEDAGATPLGNSERNVFWVFPSSADALHHWRHDAARVAVLELLNGGTAGDEAPPVTLDDAYCETCDVMDYSACLRLVLRLVDRFGGRNISLIHLGSKMQSVGAALALGARTEVALVGARPSEFNAPHYSSGIGEEYLLDLGELDVLWDRLCEVGTISIEVPT